ncbi:hypothetical protein D918_05227, partial [Trichuris suis]
LDNILDIASRIWLALFGSTLIRLCSTQAISSAKLAFFGAGT